MEVVEALDAIEVVVGVGVIVPLVVPPEPFVTIMNQRKDIVQVQVRLTLRVHTVSLAGDQVRTVAIQFWVPLLEPGNCYRPIGRNRLAGITRLNGVIRETILSGAWGQIRWHRRICAGI